MNDFYEMETYAVTACRADGTTGVLYSSNVHKLIEDWLMWHDYNIKAGVVSIMGFDCDGELINYDGDHIHYPDGALLEVKNIHILPSDAEALLRGYEEHLETVDDILNKI